MIKAIVLLLAVFTAKSHAQLQWGGAGHAIVAAIANSFLGKNASQLCKNLLPEVKGDLSQIASWADEIKHSAGYQWSGNLHFINTPDWNCSYIRPRDCNDRTYGSNYCVDTAVQNYTSRLNNQRGQQQIEALKFLVHFIGDIHQPLHVGFTTDAGGNTISGTFERTSCNLHSVWDTHIIAKRITDDFAGSQTNYINYFVKQLNGPWAQQADQWRKCSSGTYGNACSPQWASESIGLACTNAYVEADGKRHVPNNFRLADPYYTRNMPVVEQQLARGGIRLANVLNTLAPGLLSKP